MGDPFYTNILSRLTIHDEIEVDEYRNGLRVHFPGESPGEAPESVERASQAQSAKSRHRCAFTLGNAETDWLAMMTLTYRINPEDYETVKRHRTRTLESARKKWGKFDYAWFLEFTKKGTAHYHVFLGSGGMLGKLIKEEETETVTRKGKKTKILRGEVDASFSRWWINQVGDDDPGFRAFQEGGIIELVRHPDAAGRYAAKEAGKRVQKSAPWPVRQWWYQSPHLAPSIRKKRIVTVKEYLKAFPDGKMHSRTYDKELLKKAGFTDESIK